MCVFSRDTQENTLSQTIPGTPPIVTIAHAILTEDLRRRTKGAAIGGFGVSAFVFMAVMLASGTLVAALEVMIPGAAIGVVIGAVSAGLPTSQRHDAFAILRSWERHREAWADEALAASMEQGPDDIRAYSGVARSLDRLRSAG